MGENLVIVESPAKAKTIEKFLGKNFLVKSSFGHIRDLVKKDFGVDVEHDYEPIYEISPEKKQVVSELKKLAKSATTVWLASDEDREGEAIAWHLSEVLNLKKENTKRIVFHEITKNAIEQAIKNPRSIDLHLVDAQQARRILDRLVGFELSGILWKKVKTSLSAGRVQSVAVRLIVEREREIINFKSTSAYKISAIFMVNDKDGKQIELKAEYPLKIDKKEKALDFLNKCIGSEYVISNLETKPSKKSPAPPFTTSTLQQEASRKLGFSVAQTMLVAQKLYEEGKITYMRTDSVNLSDEAINNIRAFINSEFGEKYSNPRQYKTKSKGAQEAHEAIRPTSTNKFVSSDRNEQRLYELIFNRTVASQMSEALLEKTNVDIKIVNSGEILQATGEVVKFDGFLKLYAESNDDENDADETKLLPPLKIGQKLNLDSMVAAERFTHHAPRYTEASLVKKMEELGIGRPSTYAPTISTIQKREYVVKEERAGVERSYNFLKLANNKITQEVKKENTGAEKNKLFPTDMGMIVTDYLLAHFDDILSYDFTANVEKDFDEIAQGLLKWNKMIDKFYKSFHPKVLDTIKNAERSKGERNLGTDKETGLPIIARFGRFGPIVQLGESNSEKVQYASLKKDQHLETITLEEAIKLLKQGNDGRYLGIDPKTGKKVFARVGKYGPMAQIGELDSDVKPQYAKIIKGLTIETITLDQALELFKLPRNLGEYLNKTIIVNTGRFGPYVSHDGKFVSLKKTDDPMTITYERAIELIKEKIESDQKKLIKEFPENSELKIIKDRWGKPCVKYKKQYVSLSKTVVPEDLTYKECLELLNIDPEKEQKTKKKAHAAKSGTKKKTSTAKKTTTKKK